MSLNYALNGQLRLSVTKPSTISIITADGKMILREKLSPGLQSLNVSNLSKGIYWLTTTGIAEK